VSGAVDNGPTVGRRIRRAEDRALLSGAATFVGDVRLDGMLDVAFCRAQVAHARIASVDVAAARALPGVEAVFGAADLDGLAPLVPPLFPPDGQVIFSPERPLLARDTVRFVGELVAMAVASDRYIAEDACDLVAASYEPLPVVPTVDQAREADAVVLHPEHGSNVLFSHAFDSGGVEDALKRADIVLRRRFDVSRLAPSPMENRAILAAPSDDGGVRIWYSTQTPYVLKRTLGPFLGIDPELIRVTCPQVGGGFGQKSHVYPEDILVPWLALKLGRPVRFLEDRTENLIASCHARGQTIDATVAATSAGEVLAVDADITVDVGAYGVYPHGQLIEVLGTPNMLTGPYRTPELRFEARAVATNLCPGGGYRGVGLAAAVFVHERMLDIVAAEVGITPAEIRRRNLLTPADLPHTNPKGMEFDNGDYPAALELALEAVGADDLDELRAAASSRGALVGLGLCSYNEYTGMGSNVFQGRGMVAIVGYEESRVTITLEGNVVVRPTVPTTGQGSATAFAQLVADGLSVPLSMVEVRQPDTSAGPDGSGAFASRGTVVGGTAMQKAAASLRERIVEVAARQLRIEPDDVEIADGAVFSRDEPTRRMSFAELALVGESYLDVTERYDPSTTTFSYGTHACIVEVQPDIGSVRTLRYAIADDVGKLINPLIVDGQTQGSTVQGFGVAFLEAVAYDGLGQPNSSSLADYLLPTASDVPRFRLVHVEDFPGGSPGGFRGAGESGTVAAPAALVNAVSNALGAELNHVPVTPDDLFSAATAGTAIT
jgi:carbon-monoxide dehydrogenase large subunit